MIRPVPPAKFLPGQLERIRGVEFGPVDAILNDFRGGYDSPYDATLAFRFRDIDLVDGTLYGSRGARSVKAGRRRLAYERPLERISGALYDSWLGHQWFGSWLMEDCLTYQLAERIDSPVTAKARSEGHASVYEALLGFRPRRVERVHFDELVIFEDIHNNDGKKLRAQRFRDQLIGNRVINEHPGVFLMRGEGGMRRVLLNEREIAEQLRDRRGFRVIDPLQSSVEEIIDACAGARVVAGVEGSQLVHGLMLMPANAALFVIQPPHRVVSTQKQATDRQGQTFSFVIASGGHAEFSADWDEVAHTLDLLG